MTQPPRDFKKHQLHRHSLVSRCLKRFAVRPHYPTVFVIAGKLGLPPGPGPIRSNHNQFKQIPSTEPEQAKMLPSPLELILGRVVKRTSAGSEVVDGHSTKIEDVTVVEPDGKTVESRVWEAADLKGIPVKIESHLDGVTLRATYRDIVIGAPDEMLFRIPDRCTPFEKMGQVAESRVLN